ncbi:uncharacterized protein LOC106664810 isoform X2 [Cimex lectularius]|uniref:Uncharacterized protein n=1 Tax=Cimex lectularius TaxID=79782 RepID=A0A8I6RQG1_CIMLE|nr:uncharacterized protein LOC106664810 isoform X2 [Cimex lectularius]
MAIMYTFCFCLSFKYIVFVILAVIWANMPIQETRKFLKPYMEDQNLLFISDQAKLLNEDPRLYSYITLFILVLQLLSTFGELHGAYYCHKYWLLPFVVLEAIHQLFITFLFITMMMLIKENSQDLGLLISTTLAGSFTTIFLFYCLACVIALFQSLKELGLDGLPGKKKPVIQGQEKKPNENSGISRDLVPYLNEFRRYTRYPGYRAPSYPQPAGYGQLIAPIY